MQHPCHNPAPTQTPTPCSPQPQGLPNSKLDFVAQDLADLWTKRSQGQAQAIHSPPEPPGMPRDPPGAFCLAKRSSRLERSHRGHPPLPLHDTRADGKLKIC